MKLLVSLDVVVTDCSGHQNRFNFGHPNINSPKKKRQRTERKMTQKDS